MMTLPQIEEAISCLTAAHKSIDSVRTANNSMLFVLWMLSDFCRDAWGYCNKARLHTEKEEQIEEALIPAMGQIADAKFMFDHLGSTGLGMTDYAQRCIVAALQNAQIVLGGLIKDLDARLCCDCEEDLDEETATFLREYEF